MHMRRARYAVMLVAAAASLCNASSAAGAGQRAPPSAFAAPPHAFGSLRAPGKWAAVGKRKATGRFSQGLVAAAKDVWSVAGANTAMQNIMGMGAGVSTEDVCTLRHDTLGTGIELWHGSFGWFDFMAHDGAPVILSDTWGIQVERPTQVLPSGGMQYSTLRRANEAQETEEYRMPDATVKAGSWTATVEGDYIMIKNQYASRQTIVLSDDGFIFLGSRGVCISVLNGKAPEEMPAAEALKLLPGYQPK